MVICAFNVVKPNAKATAVVTVFFIVLLFNDFMNSLSFIRLNT